MTTRLFSIGIAVATAILMIFVFAGAFQAISFYFLRLGSNPLIVSPRNKKTADIALAKEGALLLVEIPFEEIPQNPGLPLPLAYRLRRSEMSPELKVKLQVGKSSGKDYRGPFGCFRQSS